MTFFYLHGWASSPDSNKALFFKQLFAQQGITLQIPDLNQDDFFHLTLSRQIQQVQALLPNSPVTLIGSSLGALTALWIAERQPQVQQLILLAPALDFSATALRIVTQAQRIQWREQGQLNLYHYAYAKEIPLSYAFVEDLHQYVDAHLQRQLPTLILHGLHDETIPIQATRTFVATRPWIQLIELDSDHSLASVHQQLWDAIKSYCSIT